MHRSMSLFERLTTHRLIALLSPKRPEEAVTAYETLDPLGIVLEIAFRTPAAEAGIRQVLSAYPDALLLAGTVLTRRQVETALDAGVAGVVSADYIPEVVEACVRRDVLCIPGGLGDVGKQLVQKAGLYGCELDVLRERYPYQWIHKLFPAATETLDFKTLSTPWKSVYKGLRVVYTGGISIQNLSAFVAYDPEGIFCGSALTRSIDEPDKMREEAGRWIQIVQGAGPVKTRKA